MFPDTWQARRIFITGKTRSLTCMASVGTTKYYRRKVKARRIPLRQHHNQKFFQHGTRSTLQNSSNRESPPDRLLTNDEAEIACVSLAANSRRHFETIRAISNSEHFVPGTWRHFFRLCEEAYADTDATDALAYILTTIGNDHRLKVAFTDIAGTYLYAGSYARRYAMVVRESAIKRAAYQVCSDFSLMFKANDDDAFFMLEWLKTRIAAIEPSDISGKSNLTAELSEHWQRSCETAEEKRARLVPTGLWSLDELLDGGFEAGDLVAIGARPSTGKTALGVSMMLNAMRFGYGAGFLSLEMPTFQIIRRLVSQISEVPMTLLKGASLTEEEKIRILEAQNEISILNDRRQLFIESGAMTLSSARSIIKKCADAGCRTVFVDYLQLIKPDLHSKHRSREQEVAEVSRNLKSVAKEFGIIVVAMAQLNKDADGKAPMLASMRESEAIIQDADYVMLLDRPEQRDCLTAEYLGAQVSAIGRGFVYLRKARNGRTGTVIMNYVAEIGKFENLPQEIQL